MKAKRVTGMLLVSALAVSLFTGCGGGSSENEGGIKEFTAFYAVPGERGRRFIRVKFYSLSCFLIYFI